MLKSRDRFSFGLVSVDQVTDTLLQAAIKLFKRPKYSREKSSPTVGYDQDNSQGIGDLFGATVFFMAAIRAAAWRAIYHRCIWR